MNRPPIWVLLIFAMLLTGFILFCILIIPTAVPKSQSEMRMERGCSLTSEEYTGKKKYCGKACWRKEIRAEYLCRDNGEILVYIR